MKIGIFGDSFAADGWENQPSWWKYLTDHGHTVTCHARGGTSILWSARQIQDLAKNYDLAIWCVTNSDRITFRVDETPGVVNSTQIINYNDPHIENFKWVLDSSRAKAQMIKDWYKYNPDANELLLVGTAVVDHLRSIYKNLMLIPCFSDPLNNYFNLFTVSNKEVEHYFGGTFFKPNANIFAEYEEHRACHLSVENNRILGNLVADNLVPGIFQTGYDHFITAPAELVSFYFTKKL